jgi:hypothetical protein
MCTRTYCACVFSRVYVRVRVCFVRLCVRACAQLRVCLFAGVLRLRFCVCAVECACARLCMCVRDLCACVRLCEFACASLFVRGCLRILFVHTCVCRRVRVCVCV